MNLAERIAATYLRLNGFLLLSQFTTFGGEHHNHIDLVGLRAASSWEGVGSPQDGARFALDSKLFAELTQLIGADSESTFVGVLAEVKANKKADAIVPEDLQYFRNFLGNVSTAVLIFRDSSNEPMTVDGAIEVGTRYVLPWIGTRFESMKGQLGDLTKVGSWSLSEPTLADLLLLHKYGVLMAAHPSQARR